MNEFFSWELILTYAGAVTVTAILTQFWKGVFKKINTQIVSYLIALILLLMATLFSGKLSLDSGVLCFVNAAVVSLASNGAFDAIKTTLKK